MAQSMGELEQDALQLSDETGRGWLLAFSVVLKRKVETQRKQRSFGSPRQREGRRNSMMVQQLRFLPRMCWLG